VIIERQKNRLAALLEQKALDPRHPLRRWGRLDKMGRVFNEAMLHI
jgi:hypothetical protein